MWYGPILLSPRRRRARGRRAALLVLALTATNAWSGDAAAPEPSARVAKQAEPKAYEDTIQITAQRVPESVLSTPAAVTVIDGAELSRRGVRDLAGALAGVAGVSIGPGGDGGPASSVPEFMGLREFDAFLLVVDGVPSGGAFNPALATLDLTNLDRIEVLRGPAPVPFGATSFVGVIHVIHNDAQHSARTMRVTGGSHGSFGVAGTLPLPGSALSQSLSLDFDRRRFDDSRAQIERRHLRWSGDGEVGTGDYQLGLDVTLLDQDPTSPHLREGRELSRRIRLDANHNPRDAKLDEQRFQLSGSYNRPVGPLDWSTSLSWTHSVRDTVRGFISEELPDTGDNARGYRQDFDGDDWYLDTRAVWSPSDALSLVGGLDVLAGRGEAESRIFEYRVGLDGSNAPRTGEIPPEERPEFDDERFFAGVYLQGLWSITPRLRFEAGLRYNRTRERQEGEVEADGEELAAVDRRTERRFAGSAGLSFMAWRSGTDSLWLFANYRDTFKPAAVDFGPEAEGDILEPETAQTVEAGIKGTQLDDRLIWQLSAFRTNFENLVVSQSRNGLPSLINAGEERFMGWELQTRLRLASFLTLDGSFARHSAKFRDFAQTFGNATTPTQLRGKRLELSARNLASFGVTVAPAESGAFAYFTGNYIGSRFLNKRNTAPVDGFTTLNAGVGYRVGPWELRIDGNDLTDRRDPISESELGDAQYYRTPGRSFFATLTRTF